MSLYVLVCPTKPWKHMYNTRKMTSSGGVSLRSWYQLCMCCSFNIVLCHTDFISELAPRPLHWHASLAQKCQAHKTTKAEAARLWDSQALSLALAWFFTSFSSSALAVILLRLNMLTQHWLTATTIAPTCDESETLVKYCPITCLQSSMIELLLSLSSWATLCCKVDFGDT